MTLFENASACRIQMTLCSCSLRHKHITCKNPEPQLSQAYSHKTPIYPLASSIADHRTGARQACEPQAINVEGEYLEKVKPENMFAERLHVSVTFISFGAKNNYHQGRIGGPCAGLIRDEPKRGECTWQARPQGSSIRY